MAKQELRVHILGKTKEELENIRTQILKLGFIETLDPLTFKEAPLNIVLHGTVDVNEKENRIREEIQRGSTLGQTMYLKKWDVLK